MKLAFKNIVSRSYLLESEIKERYVRLVLRSANILLQRSLAVMLLFARRKAELFAKEIKGAYMCHAGSRIGSN